MQSAYLSFGIFRGTRIPRQKDRYSANLHVFSNSTMWEKEATDLVIKYFHVKLTFV